MYTQVVSIKIFVHPCQSHRNCPALTNGWLPFDEVCAVAGGAKPPPPQPVPCPQRNGVACLQLQSQP
eukprot:m.39922 g.39922  ORF g.39922 m.39922 type:complete len:67 (-) comp12714_c0_seq4:434-634(-)